MEILEKDLKMVPGSGMTIAMSSVTMEMEVGYWSQVSDLVINKQLNLPGHICFYDSAVSIVHRTTSGSSVAHRTLEQGVAGSIPGLGNFFQSVEYNNFVICHG